MISPTLLRFAWRYARWAVILNLGMAPICVAAEQQFKRGDWPFVPLRRPDVPKVRDAAWVRNSIDAFVLAQLEKKDLRPSREARRHVLLRRVTYDLAGLPPTVQELDEFLADRSPDAYEKAVDRLLASPRYGERWAQHWFDVVRFAEPTVLRTTCSGPTPTSIGTTSSDRSMTICPTTASSASNWPATNWSRTIRRP